MTTDISVSVRWDPATQQEVIDDYDYDGGNSSSRLFERSRIKALAGILFLFKTKNHVTHFPTLSHKSATNRMDPPANRQQHLHGQTKKCTTNKKNVFPYYAQSGLCGRDSAIYRTYNEQSPNEYIR